MSIIYCDICCRQIDLDVHSTHLEDCLWEASRSFTPTIGIDISAALAADAHEQKLSRRFLAAIMCCLFLFSIGVCTALDAHFSAKQPVIHWGVNWGIKCLAEDAGCTGRPALAARFD